MTCLFITVPTYIPRQDRYASFLRMIREWRHLKMLKRFGRGHDPGGVGSTAKGELSVLCPACPHPDINLPLGWETAPVSEQFVYFYFSDKLLVDAIFQRWLYTLFLAIDANFRLKRKVVSSDLGDPSLSQGWSYFVEESGFKSYLAAHHGEQEVLGSILQSFTVTHS